MIVTDQIEREDETHTYWDVATGRRKVGLTELLRAHGYLTGPMVEAALVRGRNVHLAIHYYEKGLLKQGAGLDPKSLSPRIRPYFDSYIAFKETTGFVVTMTEQKLYDEIAGLCCTMDAAGTLRGVPGVIDFKSGVVSNWVRYQTASFANALPALPRGRKYKRWGLQLRPDGKPAKLTTFDDDRDLVKIRQMTSVFYTWVNDGIVKWPQTWKGFEKQRSETNGDDLFNQFAADKQDVRGSEDEARETSIPAGFSAALL